jgi:hypothetical protein
MKHSIFITTAMTFLLFNLIILNSCQKKMEDESALQEELESSANQGHGHLKQTKFYSAEAALKWHDMQLRILRLPAGVNPYGLNGVRNFAYCGIALYEAVVPGMPAYQSMEGQLNGFPDMPSTEPGKAYHWPTCANAALAYMNKHFYTATNTPAFQASMDSLENALNTAYQGQVNAETFQRSKDFGKAVAELVFNWSTTDGSLTVYPPYVPPAYPKWNNLAPNPPGIVGPYWGNNRQFVLGSTNGTASPLPPPYSEVPGSPYYEMIKEVYDISQALTPAQQATALYFSDDPGFKSGTHYLSIFGEIMHKENPALDFFAQAQAKTGISMAEAMIDCWKIKYTVLQDRPTKYIRNVLGHTTWNPFIPLHPHPEFPSGHTSNAGAFAGAMNRLFGNHYQFTIHTYDNLGMTPRTYHSFNELAEDVGRARVYGGIHYTYSCVEGARQGNKIANNILNILRFRKGWGRDDLFCRDR